MEWYSRQHPAVKVLTVIGGGAVATIAGVVAAPAVGAALSGLGLGVAGGTLSGAAASSSGLAWLGGGAVAANGLGIAGGTAVVGAVAGASGTGCATYAATKVAKQGTRYDNMGKNARRQQVTDDGVRFEG
jgi:hypothetical protein